MSEIFKIEYNGYSFSDENDYVIAPLEGLGAPKTPRISSSNLPGNNGGLIHEVLDDMREINMTIRYVGHDEVDTFNAQDNELNKAFVRTNTAQELKIYRWDGEVKSIDVVPTIFPSPVHEPAEPDTFEVELQLTAPYPYFRDTEADTATLNVEDVQGFDITGTGADDWDLPFDITGGTGSSILLFNNTGTEDALMSVTFSGAQTNPTLTNVTTGEIIQILTTMSASDTITVEFNFKSGRSVLKNGTTNMESSFRGRSNYLFLSTGSTTLQYNASNPGPSAECVVSITKYYNSF